MAKLYSAFAANGQAPRPEIAHLVPQRKQIFALSTLQDSVVLEGCVLTVRNASDQRGAVAVQGPAVAKFIDRCFSGPTLAGTAAERVKLIETLRGLVD